MPGPRGGMQGADRNAMPSNSCLDRFNTPAALLDYEIVQEQVSALGRLGRALEAALTKLRDFDAVHPPSPASHVEQQARHALVAGAGYELWCSWSNARPAACATAAP